MATSAEDSSSSPSSRVNSASNHSASLEGGLLQLGFSSDVCLEQPTLPHSDSRRFGSSSSHHQTFTMSQPDVAASTAGRAYHCIDGIISGTVGDGSGALQTSTVRTLHHNNVSDEASLLSYSSCPSNSSASSVPVKTSSGGAGARCTVCGDEASGFHYGVDSCEGCKVLYELCEMLIVSFVNYCCL